MQIESLKEQVKTEVAKAFDERLKSQTAELEKLRKRLGQVESAIAAREKNREAIINRRVEELINPDVRWDAGEVRGGGEGMGMRRPGMAGMGPRPFATDAVGGAGVTAPAATHYRRIERHEVGSPTERPKLIIKRVEEEEEKDEKADDSKKPREDKPAPEGESGLQTH